MSGVGIVADLAAYRAATAELPLSARAVEERRGAVVVVDGSAPWWSAAADALAAGAAGIVVAQPAAAPAEALQELSAARVPIVIERPLLRADEAAAAAAAIAADPPPAAMTVECHGPSLPATLRDALGWARVLGGAPLVLRTAAFGRGRGLALLESAAGLAVSLVAGTQAGAPPSGRIRVTALGETLVELDGEVGSLSIATTDAVSRRIAPARFESSERLALRRAIEAVRVGSTPSDLSDLRHDDDLARAILAGSRP